jgi:hypothetical protein
MIGSLQDEPRLREQDHYELLCKCLTCGEVDLREIWEGEPSPCTATVDGLECLSVAIERAE